MDHRLSRIPTFSGASPRHADPQERQCLSPLSACQSTVPPGTAHMLGSPSLDAPAPAGIPRVASVDENAAPPFIVENTGDSSSGFAGTKTLESLDTISQLLTEQFFHDKSYRATLNYFLKKELTRTKDGATEQSRISELCDIVKCGRRAARLTEGKICVLQQALAKAESMHWARIDTMRRTEAAGIQARENKIAELEEELQARLAQQASHHEALMVEVTSDKDAKIAQLAADLGRRDTTLASQGAQSSTSDLECAKKSLEEDLKRQNLQIKSLELDLAHKDVMHKKDVEKLEGRLRHEEAERERLKRELVHERQVIGSLELSHKQAAAAQQRAEEELQRLRHRSAQELDQLQANKGELWQMVNSTRKEAAKQADELRSQIAKLTERADTAESQRDVLDREKALWTADTSVANQRITQLDKEISELRRSLLDAQKQRSQLAESTAEASAAAEELQQQMKDVQKQRDASKARLEDVETALVGAHTARQRAVERCAGLEEELSTVRCKFGDAKQALDRVKDAMATAIASRDSLEQELLQTQQELEGAQRELIEKRKDASDVQLQLETVQAGAQAAQGKLERAQAAASQNADRVAVLEGQMEALQDVVGCGDHKEAIGQMVIRVGHLETTLAEAEKARRKLHNDLMEIRGNIRVFCRIRPCPGIPAAEPIAADAIRIRVDGKPTDFYFDRVMDANASQDDVFAAVADVVQSALDGYQVCLFSYGQTGSGKTHTMNGNPRIASQHGIIPRAVQAILGGAARLGPAGWSIAVEAMYLEIYNESVRDLLAPSATAPGARAGALDANAIKHDSSRHTQVLGATRVHIASEEIAGHVVERAASSRATNATAMNETSSRSHAVFMLQITGTHETSGTVLLGSLNLVDLAGSERLARSQAEGQRQKEACAINKSLSSLGDIFQALATKSPHIPYRNSKLTYLLQPCLGGDGKTLMFVNINPEQDSAYESLCALRFASKVNSVETAARGGARRHVISSEPGTMSGRRESIGPSAGLPRRSLSASHLPLANAGNSVAGRLPLSRASIMPRNALAGPVKRPAPGPAKVQPPVGPPPRALSVPAQYRRIRP